MRSLFSLYFRLFRSSRFRWIAILASLVYILSPFDLSPDLMPILGRVDDLVVIVLMLAGLIQNLFIKSSDDEDESDRGDLGGDKDVETIDVDSVTLP
ncbi:protein of unknown function DUF1232 [Thalassoporum mexicanum PCC 7367]|uniref:YkvA family protein n=1 Tax=Thalassoporum mexicanum TaxID=3457544 RepID=UPI00029FD6E9|nr:DUF1232 domain-containing protein [Pseudanabaena sp. PCC 7367]AFY70030.1 protein of unknown function DUF1232 [Pseudanabaena sp. PCC 7367]